MGLLNKLKDVQAQAMAAAGAGAGTMPAGAGAGAPPSGLMDNMDEKLKYRALAQKLSQSGIKAPSVINSITRGEADPISGSISTTFEVTIKPDGGAPYDATIVQAMLPAGLDTMSVGDAYIVRYDPDEPTAAMIYGQV